MRFRLWFHSEHLSLITSDQSDHSPFLLHNLTGQQTLLLVNLYRLDKNNDKDYHLPPKFSVRIAIILSTDPKMALWTITGLFLSSPSWLHRKKKFCFTLYILLYSPKDKYSEQTSETHLTKVRLNLMGNWKSSWIVAHWWYRPIASLICISI